MAVRYSDHIKSHTSNKSHDVLRANRVIRETSRELGEDWKFVFRYLMTTFDKEEVDAEIKRIETMVVSSGNNTVSTIYNTNRTRCYCSICDETGDLL